MVEIFPVFARCKVLAPLEFLIIEVVNLSIDVLTVERDDILVVATGDRSLHSLLDADVHLTTQLGDRERIICAA